MVATNHMWLLPFKLFKLLQRLKFGSSATLVTFQGLNSHMWLVATVRYSGRYRIFPSPQKWCDFHSNNIFPSCGGFLHPCFVLLKERKILFDGLTLWDTNLWKIIGKKMCWIKITERWLVQRILSSRRGAGDQPEGWDSGLWELPT